MSYFHPPFPSLFITFYRHINLLMQEHLPHQASQRESGKTAGQANTNFEKRFGIVA
jgi:hypothetical protein